MGSDGDIAKPRDSSEPRPPGEGTGRRTAIGCSIVAILAVIVFWLVRAFVIG